MRTADLRAYVAGAGEEWSMGGRAFSPAELAVIERYFAYCGCGGHFVGEDHVRAKLRCPECGSDAVERGETEVLFD